MKTDNSLYVVLSQERDLPGQLLVHLYQVLLQVKKLVDIDGIGRVVNAAGSDHLSLAFMFENKKEIANQHLSQHGELKDTHDLLAVDHDIEVFAQIEQGIQLVHLAVELAVDLPQFGKHPGIGKGHGRENGQAFNT